MKLFDRLFTRCRRPSNSDGLPDELRRRLTSVCRELNIAEKQIAAHMGLPAAPRLLLIDEEAAVILSPRDRISVDVKQ
jgi:hypothetical protein